MKQITLQERIKLQKKQRGKSFLTINNNESQNLLKDKLKLKISNDLIEKISNRGNLNEKE